MTDFTLVTGASGGIGRAIALQLAAEHRLVLSARSEENLEPIRAACARPDEHLLCAHDLAAPEAAVETLLSLLRAHEGHVEHLVHAAGVFDVGPIRSLDWTDADRMFNVNLFSAIELVRQLSRKKVNAGRLRTITFLSSIASRIGVAGYHVYSATKGALNAFARSIAVELAPNVRVNCVLPGSVETAGTKHLFADPQTRAAIEAAIPLGVGSPDDVAAVVAFLVSDRARWITGQEIVVDGGRSIV